MLAAEFTEPFSDSIIFSFIFVPSWKKKKSFIKPKNIKILRPTKLLVNSTHNPQTLQENFSHKIITI